MPKEPQAHRTRSSLDGLRRPPVGIARFDHPARVVVRDREGSPVMAQHGVEDFGLFRVNRGAAVWCWMALAVIGGCRPTVRGGVGSRVF